jgi:hypothetical protein
VHSGIKNKESEGGVDNDKNVQKNGVSGLNILRKEDKNGILELNMFGREDKSFATREGSKDEVENVDRFYIYY